MATKKTTTKANTEQLKARKQAELKYTALIVNSNSASSAMASEYYAQKIHPDLDIWLLQDEVKRSIQSVQNGDMKEMEAMLVGQAKALQTMFVTLARRAVKQQFVKNEATYLNLALKTQAQSRATIQALVELKYPRQLIVSKQTNIAQGHQQVNNGVVNPAAQDVKAQPSPATKNINEPNKLMESKPTHEQIIDATLTIDANLKEAAPQRLDT